MRAAATAESNVAPKKAPALPIEPAKTPAGVPTNREVSPPRHQFATGILLMSYASLRPAGAQRPESIEVNSDLIHGALLKCKTKIHHCPDWPRACPRMGMAGTTERIQPILDFRAAYENAHGAEPKFTSHRPNRMGAESADAALTRQTYENLHFYLRR